MLVFDQLYMLVTGEPAAEIDGALAQAAARLRAARAAGDSRAVGLVAAWIDYRLDERCELSNPAISGTARAGQCGGVG